MHLFVLIALIVATTAHLDWYDFDGGNNHYNPKWGTAGDEIIRHSPHLPFADHYSHHSPRYISNLIADADKKDDIDNPRNISALLTVWGQFIDHDIVYTLEGEDPWPIEIPKCDKYFDPHCNGDRVIPFIRSAGDKKHRTNRVTSWIDGSTIYGSTYEANQILREWKDGRLKVSHKVNPHDGEFPPFVFELEKKDQDVLAMENQADHSDNEHMWAMGDVRANQHPLLFALHVLFWREHNRVAHILQHHNHHWDDQKIFDAARRYVIAEIQHITFNEFLYWLLGRPFPEKDYYDPHVDPRVHDFFATVAFRYGHSEVNDLIKKSTKGHYGDFPFWSYAQLHEHFFDPEFILHSDLGSLFEGLAYQKQKSPDAYVSPVLRNQLFRGEFPHHHFDLFAVDIQRGRDHCIPSYNHARIAYGLKPVDSWHDFDALDERAGQNVHELKSDLAKVYRNPWEADAIVGGVASDWVRTPYTLHHHDYSNLGDLFESAIISQFQRTRVGDRHWYSRNLDKINCHGLEPVEHRTLAKVIRDNVKECHIPDDVFKVWY